MFLVFDTRQACIEAEFQIRTNMRIGENPENETTRWDIPKETVNHKWVIHKPEDNPIFMAYVTNYVEAENVEFLASIQDR